MDLSKQREVALDFVDLILDESDKLKSKRDLTDKKRLNPGKSDKQIWLMLSNNILEDSLEGDIIEAL